MKEAQKSLSNSDTGDSNKQRNRHLFPLTSWRPIGVLGEKAQKDSGGHTAGSVMEESCVLELQAGQPKRHQSDPTGGPGKHSGLTVSCTELKKIFSNILLCTYLLTLKAFTEYSVQYVLNYY